MADLLTKELTPGRLAAAKQVHMMTVMRWLTRGVQVGEETIYLEGRKVGGRWHISREAIAKFEDATNPQRRREIAREDRRQHRRRMKQAVDRERRRRKNRLALHYLGLVDEPDPDVRLMG